MNMPLHICIIGGGIVGLAGSILFRGHGFDVTLLEKDAKMRDAGAGIQLQPNAVRILQQLGVYDEIRSKSIAPASMVIKTYTTGQVLHTQQLRQAAVKYGAPLLTMHRGHLCDVLYDKAISLGVSIRHGIKIETSDIDVENGVIVAGSETFPADLFIGADGGQSVVRETLTGFKAKAILPHGKVLYRMLIPEERIMTDPKLKKIIQDPNIVIWLGPECEAVTYGLDGIFNVSLTWPWSSESDTVFFGPQQVDIKSVLAKLGSWDSDFRGILELATNCTRFMLFEPEIDGEETPWIARSNNLCIIGDAAHRSLPYLGQGAAMGLESVAVLAHLLHEAVGADQLKKSLQIYQRMRKDRTAHIIRATLKTGTIFQLPDGPLQQERDRRFLDETPTIGYPNPLADPFFQEWLWGFDAGMEVQKAWKTA